MSPATRRQSQRHMPLPRPRGLETAPKPTYSQVVARPARDPGKVHVMHTRDPGRVHVTQARASTLVTARDREKQHVTETRDSSRDQEDPQQSRDKTRPRDQTRSHDPARDKTRFLRAMHPLIGAWKTVESPRKNVTATIAAQQLRRSPQPDSMTHLSPVSVLLAGPKERTGLLPPATRTYAYP